MAWNLLPDSLRDPSLCSRLSSFRRGLKTVLFTNTSVLSAIEMLHDIALYKFNIHIHIHIHNTLIMLPHYRGKFGKSKMILNL